MRMGRLRILVRFNEAPAKNGGKDPNPNPNLCPPIGFNEAPAKNGGKAA